MKKKEITIPRGFVVTNDWMDKFNKLSHGDANGYVAIASDHPYYGLDYLIVDEELENKANFCVHGGLTFGKHLSKCGGPIKDKYLEMEGTSEDDDVFIYGFDTFHYADTQSEWSLDKVIEHTKEMAKAFFMCFLEKRPLTMDIFDECGEK